MTYAVSYCVINTIINKPDDTEYNSNNKINYSLKFIRRFPRYSGNAQNGPIHKLKPNLATRRLTIPRLINTQRFKSRFALRFSLANAHTYL